MSRAMRARGLNRAPDQARHAMRTVAIGDVAERNGRLLREHMPAGDATAVATARAVSVLVALRRIADARPVTAAEIQAAIAGFMDGAKVETHLSPMGAELYRDAPNLAG